MTQLQTKPKLLHIEQIILAKDATTTLARQRFVESICALYPDAPVIEATDRPHNRIEIAASKSPYDLHAKGKRTLVFAAHQSAVRFSREEGNTCPNYWHFSPTGFCYFGCRYCYLAGTPGVWFSPSIKIYVNIDEIIDRIDATARGSMTPTSFYQGKLQDGLALDPLTGYSEKLVPFFAQHPFARQILLTKSDEVERLLPLNHEGHTILSWSLNPQRVIDLFEENTPTLDDRLVAMKKCAESGYPIRAVVMPIIPIADWQTEYEAFLRRLLDEIPISRLTIGGICSFPKALWLMERKIGKRNDISSNLDGAKSADGRRRYLPTMRIEMYSHLIGIAKQIRPELEIALCLEEQAVWKAFDMEESMGRCNCVL